MTTIVTVIQGIIGAIIASLAMYDLLTNKHNETVIRQVIWNVYDIVIMAFGVFLMAW